ncbi:LysR family transcriptional regulator [Aliivibrio kagoshimensis]|uniref:LysR family transcriptional regulator n=1 Tax=Aliivibrio kagoshimensis TaxID=2910230 RepID=UPI003D0CF7C3
MDTNKIIHLLPDMAVFVTVVESESLSEAARKLGITPSAVSRQVSRLEKGLNVKLLERTTRRIALNDVGSKAYELCREMVNSANGVVTLSKASLTKPSGTLCIAAPVAYANHVLSPLIIQFLIQYPEIKLKFIATDSDIDLIKDGVDLYFNITNQPVEGLISVKVGNVNSILCANQHYLNKNGTPASPSDLYKHNCIFLGDDINDNHWHFIKGDKTQRISVESSYAVNHSVMRLRAAKEGIGIALLPDFVAKEALDHQEIVAVLPDWTLQSHFQGKVSMQFAQSKYMSVNIRAFVDFIKLNYG